MRKIMKAACALTAAVFCACVPAFASGISEGITMHKSASYSSGEYNVDGGVMEIIAYNKSNQKAYAVNGQSGVLAVIDLSAMEGNGSDIELSAENIDIRSLVGEMDSSFSYGDMTSVAVSPDGSLVALALQDASFDEDGRAAIFSCNEDGSLTFKALVRTGVQPDMITFADDNTILTADEGEPREGYGEGIADPAGSVSIIDVNSLTSTVVGFEAFDSSADELASQGVIIMKGVLPSADFEPEYIAVSEGKAYVTLQEANAVAVLDIGSASFDGIYSIGFEDYSIHEVDIDKKDDAYNPRTYDPLRGIRMPDGIAAFTANGATYIVTANEGDAREWGDEDDGTFYISEDERDFGDGDTSPTGAITAGNSGLEGKVVFFRSSDYLGLDENTDYIFGGRTFTIFEVTDKGFEEVFTSGSDFEAVTADLYPEFYNSSNDNAVLDDRSGKKGPEAESITVGTFNGRTYAFTALERTGGVMMYDVTDPSDAKFTDYINTRDFRSVVDGSQEYEDGELDKWVTGGDVAPEGLAFISADDSPTGRPMLLAACEVSGTVAVCEIY